MTPDDWKRVKAIASEAWTRPADDRARYIAGACADDAGLEREVSSLVAAMAAAGDRFEVPPRLSAGVAALAGLVPGRLGAYEILSPIGAGGMGEVYKARDTRLDRIVAIKVLPDLASTDPASRARMEREARAVAALNHPHICTLHDIGSDDGRDFLVMEHLDGETLAARLARGPLPIEEALLYAEQIASALAGAHRAGIVHRDVKPANIMLDARAGADGTPHAKLLDFGIAKASAPDPLLPLATAPAAALDLTQTGFVLGTAHYMAPEQVDHKAADTRTDIFAFGAVLFEMLTGGKAFAGTSRSEVMSAIRERDVPRVSALRPSAPAALDRIVATCLARNPDDRYQSVEALLGHLRPVRQASEASSRGPLARIALLAAVLVAIGMGVWALRGGESEPTTPPSLTRLAATSGVIGAAALSPDGASVVFPWTGEAEDSQELALLRIGSTSRVILTRDPGVEEWPAWSPDGSLIAFVRCRSGGCGILTVPSGGGPERKLRDLRDDRYYGLAWSPDAKSIAYAERPSASDPYALFLLSTDTLVTRRLTAPTDGSGDLRFAFSPDGESLAVIRWGRGIGIHLLSVATGATTTLLSGQEEWIGGVAWSADGRSLILSANRQGVRHLWRLPVAGGELEQLAVAGDNAYYPSVSLRGDRLAFVHELRDWDLAQVSLGGAQAARASSPVARSPRIDLDPAFSPDGGMLAFVSERGGTREVWVSGADGSGARQLTSFPARGAGNPSWSPDGRFIAFHARGIKVVSVDGGPARVVSEDGERPSWSADGRWIYFRRNLEGRVEIWRVPADGGSAVRAIDSEAMAAREDPGGTNLYFVRVGGGLWRRPVRGGDEVPVIPGFKWSLIGYWDVAHGGVYYVDGTPNTDQAAANSLRFFDFARRRAIDVGYLPGFIEDWVGGLTVSANRRSVVYSHRTYKSSEVRVVEHFR